MVKILIADDHKILREGIKNVLEMESDFEVVGEAGNGEEALRFVKEHKPDIALVDINMPKINGIELVRRISEGGFSTRCIVLTIHDDEGYVLEVMQAGAAGYLLKDVEPSILVMAINNVMQGETFFHPTLAKKIINEAMRVGPTNTEEKKKGKRNKKVKLTPRELEVMQLIGKGLRNCEIADTLFLSEKTVKNHLTNIFRKLGVNDRTQALLCSIKNHFVILQK